VTCDAGQVTASDSSTNLPSTGSDKPAGNPIIPENPIIPVRIDGPKEKGQQTISAFNGTAAI
jgi:hypothetical protein